LPSERTGNETSGFLSRSMRPEIPDATSVIARTVTRSSLVLAAWGDFMSKGASGAAV
jgi:hypothetical protein